MSFKKRFSANDTSGFIQWWHHQSNIQTECVKLHWHIIHLGYNGGTLQVYINLKRFLNQKHQVSYGNEELKVITQSAWGNQWMTPFWHNFVWCWTINQYLLYGKVRNRIWKNYEKFWKDHFPALVFQNYIGSIYCAL